MGRYYLNIFNLIETPLLPDGVIIMETISQTNKEFTIEQHIEHGNIVVANTKPKDARVWGIKWEDLE